MIKGKEQAALSTLLRTDRSFDIIEREFIMGDKVSALFFVDGFIKDEIYEKMFEFFFKAKPEEIKKIKDMRQFSLIKMPYVEVDNTTDAETAATAVLSGQAVLTVDGIEGYLLIDTRTYPVRSIKEPEKDRSLRGSRDGFVETLIFNTAMIRRRIRDERLTMEYHTVGSLSKVDVAICYMDGKCNKKALENLKRRLKKLNLNGVSMTAQAISERLVPTNFFNPFPKIKLSERPDFVSACLLEGKIALIMDNSPSVMLFATSFADFTKETDDYYFPPLTGSFVRTIRLITSILTVILTPLYLYFINHQEIIPPWLGFIKPKTIPLIPILAQLLILEFVIDALKLASLNTPDSMAGALGIVGGLLLSEFAIDAGWFSTETILYMAFVAIANYSQPSFEMGYAQKFCRISLLILTQIFSIWGFAIGIIAILCTMIFSHTLSGFGYFYPIIPFNGKSFLKLFVRTRIK